MTLLGALAALQTPVLFHSAHTPPWALRTHFLFCRRSPQTWTLSQELQMCGMRVQQPPDHSLLTALSKKEGPYALAKAHSHAQLQSPKIVPARLLWPYLKKIKVPFRWATPQGSGATVLGIGEPRAQR